MLAKKQKLQVLKQAVIRMKNQLTQNSTQPSLAPHLPPPHHSYSINQPSKIILAAPQTHNHSKSCRKQHASCKLQSPSQVKLQPTIANRQSISSLSPAQKLKTLKENVDKGFYGRKSASRTKCPQMQSLIVLGSMTDRRYYESVDQSIRKDEQAQVFGKQKDKNSQLLMQRQRTRIFSLPFKDPILFPQQAQLLGKKIVNKIEPSPSGFLTDHPDANQNLRFYGNVGIVSQSKGKIMAHRNRSPIFQPGPRQPERQSSKRHFSRYFAQQFSSCM